MTLEPGTRLGPCEILAAIVAGGRDPAPERWVPTCDHDPATERFVVARDGGAKSIRLVVTLGFLRLRREMAPVETGGGS